MLSHGNITSNVNVFPDMFDIGPDDRTASFLPWAHAFGQTIDLHFVIAAGASAGLTSAQTLMDDLGDIRPTILVSVPTVYNRLYDALQKMMEAEGGVKKAMFDAAVANARKREQMRKRGSRSRWVDLQNDLFDKLVFSKVRERFGAGVLDLVARAAHPKVEDAAVLREQRAVGHDPAFVAAHALLSESHSSLYWFWYDRSPERLEAAREAALRALELDPDSPEGHRALGSYHYYGHRDYQQALEEYTQTKSVWVALD